MASYKKLYIAKIFSVFKYGKSSFTIIVLLIKKFIGKPMLYSEAIKILSYDSEKKISDSNTKNK